MYDTALTHLGLNTSKHQDWFDDNDDEIQKLLGEKRDTHRAHQQDRNSASKKAAYYSTKRKVQTIDVHRTPGSVKRQTRYNSMQTVTTPMLF